ncbi:uncharacterized protein EV420DRAFT_1702100 [Desarmillaria tabescens]|uniref:Glucose-methanol-choline oxidoreductase C-terminal domain-containing protein n=1 Tax=Armillaria tabescens TaxID=1929756 RepID=A0AA39JZV5_ARMTA|nr:uncharacterized protein EV420DRAFT_1702100 [Desarmillaria tabescens]KAK0451987.1 hypothetical protein EV420DRAFT_1702100 [Desarmillaria tabescens]
MDYLKTAHSIVPSFHHRVGKPPILPAVDAPRTPANAWGFPQPGIQSPTPAFATASHYFVDDPTWNHGEFDDVVVGSGLCALAYIDTALKLEPKRKILVLERGGFWLPEHFQNLPLPFKLVLGGPSETFPWQLSSKTFNSELKYMHGSCPFFGGRSTFWSAWCPRPTLELMRGFPNTMLETASTEEFWTDAEELLHVTPTDKLDDPVFAKLQKDIDERLIAGVKAGKIQDADSAESARLAVGMTTSLFKTIFNKFSTPGPLLKIYERQRHLADKKQGSPLMITTDTVVERFEVDPEDSERRANILHTSRGALCFPQGKTNIILATGAIPATTILMNSLGDDLRDRAGARLSGHFLTHIAARFPITEESGEDGFKDHLEIGATYVAGKDPKTQHQYHIQVTAIHSPHPETDAEDAARLCPDYAAAATEAQLVDSERHIVLVCATLGELSEKNPHSWVKQNLKNPDVTTNIRLQVDVAQEDKELWDIMDKATYDAIQVMADDRAADLEYWHDSSASWKKERPKEESIHIPGVVHESSTLYMSDDLDVDKQASVGPGYNPRGCNNVYVTGGALFPSSGSWNPTLTMCGYAQDLAKRLVGIPKQSSRK